MINIITIAIIQILASIIVGVFILFLTFRLLNKLALRRYKMQKVTTAYSIFVASVIFSVGYLVDTSIAPILSALKLISRNHPSSTAILIFEFIKYSSLFVLIALIVSAIVNVIGVYLFTWMTMASAKLDEFKEIGENNIGVSIIVGSIVIVLAIFVKDGLELLLDALVPHLEKPHIGVPNTF